VTSPVLSLEVRQDRLTAILTKLAGGHLKFYPNLPPATTETATPEILIASIPFPIPIGVVGVAAYLATLQFSVPQTASALTTDLIGWVRFCKANGVGVMDVLVVASPAAGPVVVSSLQTYTGGDVMLMSGLLTE